MRYFLEIAFKGTNYNGWQVQPNGIGVQQKIDEALQAVLREDIHCIGCGRTDAGVHASQFYLHFDAASQTLAGTNLSAENVPHPFDWFLFKMNHFLPPDITIKNILPVHDSAHARFDAVLRKYIYYLSAKKDPFTKDFFARNVYRNLDFESMQQACGILKKYQDFPSFCKSKQGSKTTLVNIIQCEWKHTGTAPDCMHEFHISANRFLRGMVRLIVGAMMQIGKHKMTLEQFEEGVMKGERFKLALSAPAKGLFLTEVHYPYIHREEK